MSSIQGSRPLASLHHRPPRDWTPETARPEAKVQFGRVAQGDNPADERELDYKAITIKELCARYIADLNAGLNLQAV